MKSRKQELDGYDFNALTTLVNEELLRGSAHFTDIETKGTKR